MARKSLIGGLGELNNKLQDINLLNNLKTAKPSSTLRGNNISSIIEQIRINVERHLGKFKDRVTVIRDETTLAQYFDKAIDCGYMAIDTETDGLDCLENHVIGSCLYVPGEKGVYVPHRHKSYITGQLLNNQISAEFMREQFKRLDDNQVKLIFHNAKFDMRIINSNFHVYLTPYWDTMIAAKLLNNLEKASLKAQYATHILHTDKEYDFSSLFKNIEYAMCPVEIAMLYAATDAVITWDLMQWQIDQFKPLPQLYNLFMTVEMPLIRVVCDMEDTGVALDFEYAKELSVKYTKLRDEALKDVYEELDKYTDKINLYKSKFPACKLSDPINVGSPVQLATFLYDILQIQPVDKKTPRGTGEEILEKINLPICAKILRCRGLEKLLGTYIDKMPAIVDIQDKRIHASFNTIGADTGRFSSDSPNLQNIPSNNHDIRKMFKATDGYYLLGSDYSQQEPKLLTFYTKDPDMMSAYDNNRDLYATVASLAFDKPYEDCLEFYPEGAEITIKGKKVIAGYKTHTNEEGKKRRSAAKSILLGGPRGYIMPPYMVTYIENNVNCTTKQVS